MRGTFDLSDELRNRHSQVAQIWVLVFARVGAGLLAGAKESPSPNTCHSADQWLGIFRLASTNKNPGAGPRFFFSVFSQTQIRGLPTGANSLGAGGEPPLTGQMETSYAGLPYSPARRRLRRTMARTPPPLRPWRGRQGKLSAGPRPGGGVLYCRGRHKIRKLSCLDGKRNY